MKNDRKFIGSFAMWKSMRCICTLLIFTLIISAVPFGTPAIAAGTSGYWTDYSVEPAYNSNSDTYYIGSAEELAWVAKKINNQFNESNDFFSFELTSDIDLSAHYWVPIGATTEFVSAYDFNGMGHSVLNLRIEAAESSGIIYDAVGLFGAVHEGCKIWDVNVLSVNINSSLPANSMASAGALAGIVSGGNISGCSSTGTVSGSIFDYAAGGLIGHFTGGTIKDSCSDCTVSGTSPQGRATVSSGGLIGVADHFTAINCYSQGKTTSNGEGGGLIGAAYAGNVKNCYSTVDVYSPSVAGGFIGHGEDHLTVSNCYATGSVSGGANASAGTFMGEIYSVTVEHGFCLKQAAGGTIIGGNPQLLVLDVDAVSMDYMKSNEFVNMLNNVASTEGELNKWLSDTENTNDSYPVLEGVWIPALAPVSITAIPTSASVNINGTPVAFQAYNINDNNYFKLRDLAAALNGTAKEFEVGFDSVNNAISLINGKYTPVGGELEINADPKSTAAMLSTAIVYLKGTQINLTAYTINDSNYFKLRDLASAMDFGVTYDAATNTIGINTSVGYKE